jgi:predicted nucleic acid-binding protein
MGKKFLIDTNTIIDAQMKKLPENGLLFLADIINEDFTISFITYIEFLGYKDTTKASEDFIALANVIEVNKEIIDTCISLRRIRNIKLPDAIIAATALVYNLSIVSHNTSDFQNIKGLNVIDPYTL